MSAYELVQLEKMVEELGEDRVKSILSSFESLYENDVEKFLKYKAIEFGKQGLAKTQLIFLEINKIRHLVGFFTLANKNFYISSQAMGKKSNPKRINEGTRKRIKRFGTYDLDRCEYKITSLLIAQLGKNHNSEFNNPISGSEILMLACQEVKKGHDLFGGRFVYLECEDVEKLKDFYCSNGFVEFGKRDLVSDEESDFRGKYLIQMLRDLSNFEF